MPWENRNWETSLPVLAEQGYLIPAIGDVYVRCATQLAASISQWHPDANITIVTSDMLPHGDQGGYANDWQMFEVSPYRETIKLEADMWCASPIDHWWDLLRHRDVVISTGCRDFYDNTSQDRRYRKVIDANNLPDVYNAVTYWRLSRTAKSFFNIVRDIFSHWDQYKTLLKFPEDTPSTDVVYAIAAQIMGPDTVTLPFASYPRITHMKQGIIPTHGRDWTRELVWEAGSPGLRINTVAQWGLVHYHRKDWQP